MWPAPAPKSGAAPSQRGADRDDIHEIPSLTGGLLARAEAGLLRSA
jgi:hypothetical protein